MNFIFSGSCPVLNLFDLIFDHVRGDLEVDLILIESIQSSLLLYCVA